jgi:hypothetical protein
LRGALRSEAELACSTVSSERSKTDTVLPPQVGLGRRNCRHSLCVQRLCGYHNEYGSDVPYSSYSHRMVHRSPSLIRPMSVSTAQPRPWSSSSTSTASATCDDSVSVRVSRLAGSIVKEQEMCGDKCASVDCRETMFLQRAGELSKRAGLEQVASSIAAKEEEEGCRQRLDRMRLAPHPALQ